MVAAMLTEHKIKRGFSLDEIHAKDEAIRGVMRTVSADDVETMLSSSFRSIEPIWQDLAFRAWVCERK